MSKDIIPGSGPNEVVNHNQFDDSIDDIKEWVVEHRKALVWIILAVLFYWFLIAIKETTTLVILSYALALLLDPLVTKLERRGISRSIGIISISLVFFGGIFLIILTAAPAIIAEYSNLIDNLPQYFHVAADRLGFYLEKFFGIKQPQSVEEFWANAQVYFSNLGVTQIRSFFQTVLNTVLSGYSLTLTIFNLIVLPFFVFYIARDLRQIHRLILGFMPRHAAEKVRSIGGEILIHVYAFFKGQITVACILATLYVIGLSIVGVPSALVVGILSGFLNIIPYLGITVGIVLATVITLVSDPSWSHLLSVWAVFIVVQSLEGSFLTPRIVGKSVGIHPLGVMLALIIGGQLLGLLGLVIAIPVAASLRVLFRHLLKALEEPSPLDVARSKS